MSRWLEIAARAGGDLNPQPADRQEPAKRSGEAEGIGFLPVSAGLPVRQSEFSRIPGSPSSSNVISLDERRSRVACKGSKSSGGTA